MKNGGIEKECFYFCLFVNIDLIPRCVMRKSLTIIAVVLTFLGFGMIHGSNSIVEQTGSVFIGIGSLWLIIVLIQSIKKSKRTET